MNTNNNGGIDEARVERLNFMVSQLASDLEDLTDALKSGVVPYEVAVSGIRKQLSWALANIPGDDGHSAAPATDE